jgi:hypothetical protein
LTESDTDAGHRQVRLRQQDVSIASLIVGIDIGIYLGIAISIDISIEFVLISVLNLY